jgi:hypothetical protein
MAPKHDAWSGPIVQAVDRIFRIRGEVHQLELEESVLREAVLSALEGVAEEEFPLRLGSHDVRIQSRMGRVDEASALKRLAELGLDNDVPRVPEILSVDALSAFEAALYDVQMGSKSRERLVKAWRDAIGYQRKVDGAQLRAWRASKRLSEADYRQCFRDGKAVVRFLTIR